MEICFTRAIAMVTEDYPCGMDVLLWISQNLWMVQTTMTIRKRVESERIMILESVWLFCALVGLETAVLDIVLSYHAYHSLKLLGILRLFLKLLTSAAWFIILTVCYVHTWSHPSGLIKDIQGWLGKSWENSYLYVAAVVVYLVPNIVGGLFFLFPMLRRWIESSNWRIVRSLMWWSQVCFLFFCTFSFCTGWTHVWCTGKWLISFPNLGWMRYSVVFCDSQPRLYIGRGMHESQFALFGWATHDLSSVSSIRMLAPPHGCKFCYPVTKQYVKIGLFKQIIL
jgi:hypothetical protein